MAASPKEQIQAQALASFKTREFDIGNSKIVIRELTVAERKALDESNYQMKDGEFIKDDAKYMIPVVEKKDRFIERWISAAIMPKFTVDELAEWPNSLKVELWGAVAKINNIDLAETVAKK